MPYPPQRIAEWILAEANESGQAITPMKLQKLVYIAHGWHMAANNGVALVSEPVEAWQWGPVFPSLYQTYREFGSRPILSELPKPRLNESACQMLDWVWQTYGSVDALRLSALTHLPETPWSKNFRPYGKTVIPNAQICDHYQSLLRRLNEPNKN